jgi:hypothetical protein
MIDTTDLSSYYPGYDEYCEPKEENYEDDYDIDAIIDERRLQEMEENRKETDLFKVVYTQGVNDGQFDISTYHNEFLERVCKIDPSTYLAIKKTIMQALENIEKKVKEGDNGSN